MCLVTVPSITGDAFPADQATALVMLRREEKLAHDVYVTLGGKFDPMPFRNIPRSEIQHARALNALLVRHGIADPVESLPPNRFDVESVQALYDDFIERGSVDVKAALAVGVEVEELDISGLRAMLATNSPEDVKAVVVQLERASQNHLRAFHRNLVARGGSYQPKHLSQGDFDAIVARAGSGRN